MQKNQLRLTLLVIAIAAIVGGWLSNVAFNLKSTVPALRTATVFSTPRMVTDFNLQDAHGQPFSNPQLKDRWTLLFFGYTSCPDVCPTTLNQFASIWKSLTDAERARLQFVFVSVDPKRDTLDKLAAYVSYFSSDFIGATGSAEQIASFTKSLGVPVIIQQTADGNYTVDHSASLFVINPQQQFAATISPPYTPAALTSDLKQLAAQQ
jgi:protein SCO1/2